MIDGRRECEADFADDLHPELEGGTGIGPRGLGQSGPGRVGIGCGVGRGRAHDDLAFMMTRTRRGVLLNFNELCHGEFVHFGDKRRGCC